MKRRTIFLIIAIISLTFVCFAFYKYQAIPDGSTVESREELLKNTPQGTEWSIAVEQTIDDYIISGVYSTNGKSGIAVFEPIGNGKYKMFSREWRNNDEIIISGAIINNVWYDLIWYNGAATSYAEIKYTIAGDSSHVINHNSESMAIFCNPAPAKDYSLDVVYYDEAGNKYE